MTATDRPEGCHLVLEPARLPTLAAAGERNVLGVVYDATADEFRRRLRTELPWEPVQTGLVETYEVARSGAVEAGTVRSRVLDRELALTTVKRPADAGTMAGAVGRYLDGWADSAAPTAVVVDSLAGLVADDSREAAVDFVADLADRVAASGGVAYVCLDDTEAAPRLIEQLRRHVDAVHGEAVPPTDAVAAVARLRADDPTTFGYVRRHWREAGAGVEAADRAYAQARQVHEALDDPETTPRSLGLALNGLVRLGVLDVWGDGIGANRYDLRAFDRDRFAAVGLALDAQED